jgi:DNA (cytosine-5)-methyltransferase 1
MANEVTILSKFHDYDFKKYKGNQRLDKVARNLVDYEVGRTILETSIGVKRQENINQLEMF